MTSLQLLRASAFWAVFALVGGSSSAKAAEVVPFKIGFLFPLSGPAAGGAAEGGQQGMKLALEEINGKHLAARRFETVVVDDASDPRTAADACSRLILQDKVDAIISQGPTANRMACNQVALRANIPHLAALSGPGGMCFANLVMIGPETSQTLLTLVKQVAKDGNKKLFYIGTDSSAVRDALPLAKATAEANGSAIVGSTFSPPGTTDFSTELGKIAAERPEVVIMMLVGADAVTFALQFGNDDRVKAIKRADFLMTEKVLRSLGKSGQNMYSAASYYGAVPGEASETFKASLKRMFSDKAAPDAWAVMVYNSMYVLAKAIKTPTSGAKEVLEALPDLKVDGPQGSIKIQGRYISTPIFVATTVGDGGVRIDAVYNDVPPAPHCK